MVSTNLRERGSTLLFVCLFSVCYKLHEDPKLLLTGQLPGSGSTIVALAPDAKVVAMAINFSLYIFCTSSGEVMEKLLDVHGGELLSIYIEHNS